MVGAEVIYLDTHVLICIAAGETNRLGAAARKAIDGDDVLASAASVLKLEFLHEIGKLKPTASKLVAMLAGDIGLRVCDLPFRTIVEHALTEAGRATHSTGSSWRTPRRPALLSSPETSGFATITPALCGDAPSRGSGPDGVEIERQGNTYLDNHFPRLDYIKTCSNACTAATATRPRSRIGAKSRRSRARLSRHVPEDLRGARAGA